MKKIFLFLLCLVSIKMFGQKSEPRFVGDYYPATSESSKYGIIVLGGAEGGRPTELAKMFADEGYSVLSLAYFKDEGLPPELEKIPLEYFNQPIEWILRQDEVNHDGVLIVGWSKGAELALLLASKDKRIKGVIAISPSSVVWAGILKDWKKTPGSSWTWRGKEVHFVPFDSSGGVNSLISLYSNSLKNEQAVSRATIHIERSKARFLLLSGSQDEVWPSSLMTEQLIKNPKKGEQGKKYTHLNYPDRGHLLDEKFLLNPSAGLHPSRLAMLSFLGELNTR